MRGSRLQDLQSQSVLNLQQLGLGLGFSGGGERKIKGGCEKKELVVLFHEHFLFSPPPRPEKPRPQLLEIEDSLRLEVLKTRSPS